MAVTIRPEAPADAAAIHAVTRAAFATAAHASGTEQHIVDALRAAGQLTISLVADEAGVVVGHVAISPVTLSDGARGWYGLGPVSVHPDRQRAGIGVQLVERALDLLRQRSPAGCVVLGDPAYYGRFGFRADPALALPGVPPEVFQALTFDGATPRATVAYHAGFEATG